MSFNLEKLVKRYNLDRNDDNNEPIAETLDDVKNSVNTRLDRMEANISLVLEHILNEVTSLRQETSELRAHIEQQDMSIQPTTTMNSISAGPSAKKFKGANSMTHSAFHYEDSTGGNALDYEDPDPLNNKNDLNDDNSSFSISGVTGSVIPSEPFTTVEGFLQFAQDLEDSPQRTQHFMHELFTLATNNCDKFVRNCWRRILHDHVAEHFTWRGTAQKQSVRDMALTRALSMAARQMYQMDDDNFERVTRKYFQYARDRLQKIQKYHEAKL